MIARRTLSAVVCALGLVAVACGVNRSGEPLEEARSLAAGGPRGSSADVTCNQLVSPMECEIFLNASPPLDEAVAEWWYRVQDRLDPPVDAKSSDAIFVGTRLYAPGTSGRLLTVGWWCPGDDRLSENEAYVAMQGRDPSLITRLSLVDARDGGCELRSYPTANESLAP